MMVGVVLLEVKMVRGRFFMLLLWWISLRILSSCWVRCGIFCVVLVKYVFWVESSFMLRMV